MRNLCTFLCMGLLSLCLFPQLHAQDDYYIDLHNRGITKHVYSQEMKGFNPWEVVEHSCEGDFNEKIAKKFSVFPKRSQADMSSLVKGNVRVSCVSITPIETMRLKPKSMDLLEEGAPTLACIAGIYARTELLMKEDVDYFEIVTDHIKYLQSYEKVWL